MTPYYSQDGCTIYHGDCREVLPTLAASNDNLVVTDPPYGAGKAEWDDEFPTWWMPEAARLARTVAVMPGVVNLCRCPQQISGLVFRWCLAAYITNGMTRGIFGFGNWIPCLVYAANEIKLYGPHQDARAFSIGGDMPLHPCPKPFDVMLWLVGMLPGDVVIDPFMGSGTTLRAAKDHGRRAIGIEIDERYCEIAANRLRQGVLFGCEVSA